MSVVIHDQLEMTGRKLYQENKNYRKLCNIMEHPEFREFFDEYFKDWSDTKTILMFMKLYQEIEKQMPVLTGYQKISVLNNAFKNPKIRRSLIEKYIQLTLPSVKSK